MQRRHTHAVIADCSQIHVQWRLRERTCVCVRDIMYSQVLQR